MIHDQKRSGLPTVRNASRPVFHQYRRTLFLVWALFLSGLCFGQGPHKGDLDGEPTQNKTDASIAGDIETSARSIGSVLTSPLRWNGTDGLTAGGVVAGVAGSFLLDDEARDLIGRNHSAFAGDVVVNVGNTYCTVLYVGPSALALYLSGVAFENQWMRETGQMLVEAVVATGIIQMPLSIAVGRARPFFNEGNTSFKAFAGWDDDRASFFSGHSMIAFSFSTILAHQIDNGWATAGLTILAALGPYARLYKDRHWFSDVALGAVLGTFVGNSICNFHHKSPDTGTGFNLVPTPHGVSLVWIF